MKRLLFLLLIIFFYCSGIKCQETIRITDIPRYYTPLTDTIFLTGTVDNWQGNSVTYMMIKQTDGSYQIELNSIYGTLIEFKFTRGSWNSVETQLDGSFLSNRSFNFASGQTINCQIANWNDMLGWHTSVGNTYILDLDFPIPQLNRTRRIWVYLPQDYFSSTNYYPVVYMQDGQNIFDAVYAPFGEWNVDSTMEALFPQFSPSAIVVGIDNSVDRMNEYSPWVNTQYGGGQGDQYVDFTVNTLKPYIDSHFRTMPNRENTGIMGSSMGGLISYYAAVKYPQVFSKAGIFSPSFWYSDTLQQYLDTISHSLPQRFYFVAGQNESTTMVSDIQAVMNKMVLHGYSNSEMNLVVKVDGEHSEWFWKREFPDAFEWLFQVVTDVNEIEKNENIFFNPNTDDVNISIDDKSFNATIFDVMGRRVAESSQKKINLSFLNSGIYIVSVICDHSVQTKKIYIYK